MLLGNVIWVCNLSLWLWFSPSECEQLSFLFQFPKFSHFVQSQFLLSQPTPSIFWISTGFFPTKSCSNHVDTLFSRWSSKNSLGLPYNIWKTPKISLFFFPRTIPWHPSQSESRVARAKAAIERSVRSVGSTKARCHWLPPEDAGWFSHGKMVVLPWKNGGFAMGIPWKNGSKWWFLPRSCDLTMKLVVVLPWNVWI